MLRGEEVELRSCGILFHRLAHSGNLFGLICEID